MDPQTDLLVFTKKEIGVLTFLLMLVALLSFTLGLRVGRSIQTTKSVHEESQVAPLAGHEVVEESVKPDSHGTEKSAEHGEHVESAESAPATAEENTEVNPSKAAQAQAEQMADAALSKELDATKGKLAQPVSHKYPKDTVVSKEALKYTLQVGSHRTVAEAAEQVTLLKRKGFDAFYVEANPKGKGVWYRVGIGVFESKEEAEKSVPELKKKGELPTYLIQKVSE